MKTIAQQIEDELLATSDNPTPYLDPEVWRPGGWIDVMSIRQETSDLHPCVYRDVFEDGSAILSYGEGWDVEIFGKPWEGEGDEGDDETGITHEM